MGKEAEFETTEQKATHRKTTARYGTPKYAYAALESAVFWRIPRKFSNISGFRRPCPNAPMGNGGGGIAKPPTKTKGRRGEPRNATERYGTWRIA